MYLLYVDDSGSHGAVQGNRAYVLAGLAVHEDDAAALQRALAELVARHVRHDAAAHELHAAEIRHPKRARSIWVDTDGQVRRRLLEEALDLLARHAPVRADRPIRAFAVTLDPGDEEAQRHAFEALLHRFDAIPRELRHGRRPAQRDRDRRRIAPRAPDPGLGRGLAGDGERARAPGTPRGRAAVRQLARHAAAAGRRSRRMVGVARPRRRSRRPRLARAAGRPRRGGRPFQPRRAQVESRVRSPQRAPARAGITSRQPHFRTRDDLPAAHGRWPLRPSLRARRVRRRDGRQARRRALARCRRARAGGARQPRAPRGGGRRRQHRRRRRDPLADPRRVLPRGLRLRAARAGPLRRRRCASCRATRRCGARSRICWS